MHWIWDSKKKIIVAVTFKGIEEAYRIRNLLRKSNRYKRQKFRLKVMEHHVWYGKPNMYFRTSSGNVKVSFDPSIPEGHVWYVQQ